jgi:cytoskeleton protein RodZ
LGNQAPAVPRGETDSDWTAASASAPSQGQGADDAESRFSIADTTVASGNAEDTADAEDALAPDQTPATGPASTRIVLRANGENWIEIREGGTERLVVARLFKPGETFDVPDSPDLRLLTGNAGGLEILVDGEPVPPLGAAGMVRRNVPLDAERLRSGELARN